ncbi:MAG: replication initiator protein [Wigfec virus K19_152]|nr:MAG: replication initiator protein [Wigfec virus K19_152]
MDLSRSQGETYYNTVPCGKCPLCLKAKINSWLFRLDKELERSKNPLFCTLTYATQNLKYHEYIDTETGEISTTPTLHKKDLQDFFKRLRKAHDKAYPGSLPLKYYAVGEYGTKRKRPHYHIILFNCLDSSLVHTAWGKGHTYNPPLREGGTGYVLKYLSKPNTKNKYRQPEFSLMSKKMGDNYLTPQMIKYHKSTEKNSLVTTNQGYKMAMPKYYKEKIFDEQQRKTVTEYLQKRIEDKQNAFLALKKRQYPNRDENFYQNLLEQSKNLIKFDERKNEVL